MKTWTMVCAFAALALTTVDAQAAKAADCDLIKIFALVKPLETDENVKKCIAATGYELLPPPGAPSKDQIAKLCANDSCKTVFTTLQKMDIPDCSISILGGVNMKKVIGEAFGQCSASTPTSAAPSPSPAAGATPTPTPSMTPAVTTAKPAGASPAPGASSPAPSSGAPTPAPAAQAATPTPTPAGSSTKATGKTKRCDA